MFIVYECASMSVLEVGKWILAELILNSDCVYIWMIFSNDPNPECPYFLLKQIIYRQALG